MADKDKKRGKKPGDESVYKVVYEHKSFLYPTYALMIIMFLVITVTSITLEVAFNIRYSWLGLFANILIIIPYYLQKARRNQFIITNKRFIRNLKHPKRAAYEIPLKEIISVKYLSRAIDTHGIVQVRTTPEYGEQILIDGDTEYGVVTLFKVNDHVGFTTTLEDAAEMAKKGLSFDFDIKDKKKPTKPEKKKDTAEERPAESEPVTPVTEMPPVPDAVEEEGLQETPAPESVNPDPFETTEAKQPPPPPPDENY